MIRILLLCMACFAMNHHHHHGHHHHHHGHHHEFDFGGAGGNYYGGNANQENGNQDLSGFCCLVGCVGTCCVVIGGIAFYFWEKAKGEDYLLCPHPASVVPASTTFTTENSSICLATGALAAKVCYKSISGLISKCITSNGSGTGTTSSCTTSVQNTINSENEKMVKQIYPEKNQRPTSTEEFPSGYKVTNGDDSNGYVLRFSNDPFRSGCVDRCQPPMIANSCGSLAEMRIDENFNFLGSSWTIYFPHLKTYGQNLEMQIKEDWNPWNYLNIFKRVKHIVTFSNGVKGEIEATYLDGKVWYHYCNSWFSILTWDRRCNAQSLLTGEQKVPLEVVGKLGSMKWTAKSTFTVWNFLKNGVVETGPSSKQSLVLKGFNNSLTGIDDQQVKIVNKDSVDPTAIATLYITRYYTDVMEKAWNKAAKKDKVQESIKDEGKNIDETSNEIIRDKQYKK